MTIFNFLLVVVALALFLVVMIKIVDRFKNLEKQHKQLEDNLERLSLDVVSLDKRLDVVRKSLDNY